MLALSCCASVQAQGDPAAQRFKSGSSAFQAGNFAQALNDFEAAVAAGMTGPAVHFNIGVAAFRVGDYSRAQSAFEEVARTPSMSGLAYYNLGLVALRRDDPEGARRWFAQVEQAAGDERLRELASARLVELEVPASDRNWRGYAAFAAGYDDNVALVSNAEVLGISGTEDGFAEAQFAFSAPLDRSWRLDAALAQIDYLDLDTFDQLGIHGSGRYRWDLGEWTNEAGLQLGYGTLDGDGFENRRTVWIQTSSEPLDGMRLRARYRLSDIDGLNDFASLSGQRQDLSARLGWTLGPWEIGTELSLDVGDYDDERLSATRQQLRFDVQRMLVADWAVLFELAQRHSSYDVGSIGGEDRTELALTVSKTLSPVWRLVIRHSYTENAADQRAFDYSAMRITAGVEAML